MKHTCKNGMTAEPVGDSAQDLVRVSFAGGLQVYMSLPDMAEAVQALLPLTPEQARDSQRVRLHPNKPDTVIVQWERSDITRERGQPHRTRWGWTHVPLAELRAVVAEADKLAAASNPPAAGGVGWDGLFARLRKDAEQARAGTFNCRCVVVPLPPHPWDLAHAKAYTTRESYPDAKARLRRKLNAALDRITQMTSSGGYGIGEGITRASLATAAFAEELAAAEHSA